MKPVQIDQTEIYSELTNTQEFTIKASDKAFRILSSDLYENKIRAIIRELSCNAWDAHIEAKTTDQQFFIQCPNKIDSQFIIRDYGTGLSPEKFRSIYTVLFSSTKDKSNDFTGMLGLGSKTPFAYTSAFMVTSYYQGIEYVYSVFKNERGIPDTSLISQNQTDQHDGLKIQFAVEAKDFSKFRQEIRYVFRTWMSQIPKITGFDHDELEINRNLIKINENLYVGEKFNSWNTDTEYMVIQGNVAYPIEDRYRVEKMLPDNFTFSNRSIVYFHAPIGTIEFTPSRERLDECDHNYQVIEKIINDQDMISDMTDYVQSYFANLKDQVDTSRRFYTYGRSNYSLNPNQIRCHILNDAVVEKEITDQGFFATTKVISKDLTNILDNVDVVIINNKQGRGRNASERIEIINQILRDKDLKRIGETQKWSINCKDVDNISFVIIDQRKKYSVKTKSYFENSEDCIVFIHADRSDQKTVDKFLNCFKGFKEPVKTSQMSDVKVERKKSQRGKWFIPVNDNILNFDYNDLSTLDEIVDDNEQFYYYYTHSNRVIKQLVQNSHLGEDQLFIETDSFHLDFYQERGIIKDFSVVAIPFRFKKSFENMNMSNQAVDLFKEIKQNLPNVISLDSIKYHASLSLENEHYNSWSDGISYNELQNLAQWFKFSSSKLKNQTIPFLNEFREFSQQFENGRINRHCQLNNNIFSKLCSNLGKETINSIYGVESIENIEFIPRKILTFYQNNLPLLLKIDGREDRNQLQSVTNNAIILLDHYNKTQENKK